MNIFKKKVPEVKPVTPPAPPNLPKLDTEKMLVDNIKERLNLSNPEKYLGLTAKEFSDILDEELQRVKDRKTNPEGAYTIDAIIELVRSGTIPYITNHHLEHNQSFISYAMNCYEMNLDNLKEGYTEKDARKEAIEEAIDYWQDKELQENDYSR